MTDKSKNDKPGIEQTAYKWASIDDHTMRILLEEWWPLYKDTPREFIRIVESAVRDLNEFRHTSVEQDPLRADFEKWLPKKSNRYSTERYEPIYGNMKDMYVSALTQELWEAWQSHFKQQQGETK
jgi:hypothetical protein